MGYTRQNAQAIISRRSPKVEDVYAHERKHLYRNSKNRESLNIHSHKNLYKFIEEKVNENLFIHEIAAILGCKTKNLERVLESLGYKLIEKNWEEEKDYRKSKRIKESEKKKKETIKRKREELISWGIQWLEESDDFNPKFLQHHHTSKWSQIWKYFGSMDDYYIALGYKPSSFKINNYPKHRVCAKKVG